MCGCAASYRIGSASFVVLEGAWCLVALRELAKLRGGVGTGSVGRARAGAVNDEGLLIVPPRFAVESCIALQEQIPCSGWTIGRTCDVGAQESSGGSRQVREVVRSLMDMG